MLQQLRVGYRRDLSWGKKRKAYEALRKERAEKAKHGTERIETTEKFREWQRIVHADAIRASYDWLTYSPMQAAVSKLFFCNCFPMA